MYILHCTKCKKLYPDNLPSDVFCPDMYCHGRLVQLDEMIVPVLRRFWSLGIDTRFSCSGHYYDYASYILFDIFKESDHDKFNYESEIFKFIQEEWGKSEFAESMHLNLNIELNLLDDHDEIIKSDIKKSSVFLSEESNSYSYSIRFYFGMVDAWYVDEDLANSITEDNKIIPLDSYRTLVIAKTWYEMCKILDKALMQFKKKEDEKK